MNGFGDCKLNIQCYAWKSNPTVLLDNIKNQLIQNKPNLLKDKFKQNMCNPGEKYAGHGGEK